MEHRRRARHAAPSISALLLGLIATVAAPAASAAPGGALCQVGRYSSDGREPCTPAPPGTFVNIQGALAPSPVAPGFYQDAAGSTSAFACPAGSFSYGSATACRRITTGPINDPNNAVVGPLLLGTANATMVGNVLTFDIENATTDTASPSNLTDLTLTEFVLGGSSVGLFNLVAPSDLVLSKGEHATLTLQWLGGADQPFSISLTVKTDQDACFAGDPVLAAMCPSGSSTVGAELTVAFSGRSTAAAVPEPSTLAIAALGLGAAALRRRRSAGTQPA